MKLSTKIAIAIGIVAAIATCAVIWPEESFGVFVLCGFAIIIAGAGAH